ncbi:hypothetical protein ACYJ3J_12865 [Mycobacterium avium subsp. paratuberculosis]|uniref:hypothetical protein n=1 Tax=Mycobacterium avium TaxID=1764 RepID=UPI001CC72411|nr:hypothetical protein [Mycobacterium avium]UKO59759.1 hypothetical protein KYH25_00235 [Mycobacterium avium subsp. paratuberculosis]UKO64060.1 hypothetical protein KYF43_00235 [Mycobacterium avium subsp. paratuberculosis]UKO68365.1 hypothetical protein KYG56_00235 [Mycobacterium avium subsp. paratuberculosis]UKO72661.1 hypothetical protein KYG70_00235 [Mycobacterium avium subsp. paratuberculosis]UYB85890.1 hypothetical protein OBK31_19435 [Mycobacterium avium subsp. paratuberculosis K-10]
MNCGLYFFMADPGNMHRECSPAGVGTWRFLASPSPWPGDRAVGVVARYGRLGLLLLDELGYVQTDSRGAELLFPIITEREE